jgi:uncharacterized membrane protein YhaH (DUF805 family)
MNGYAFVKEVIAFSRDNAVDILLSKGVDECDWLEFKASFYVSDNDDDFSNINILSKKPEGYDDRQWLDELNKGRIVKDIVAMYNSRGGLILIGITPDSSHRLVSMEQNDPHGILRTRGINDYVSRINDQLATRYSWFGTARHYCSRPVSGLFESKILPYRDGYVVALIVKSAGLNDSCIITCNDEHSPRNAKSFLVLRSEDGNNCEENVSGITERKKDELDARRFAFLKKRDLERYCKEITGGEASSPAGRVSWREAWHKLWTFSLRGKASRTELWMSYGYYSVFIAGAICLSMIFGNTRILSIVQLLGFVLLAPPFVRRLHDLALSGWSLLVLIGLGLFEGFFPNLITINRIINGFFFLIMLSLGCFPGRRIYGKYKGGVFSVCFFALLVLVGLINREQKSRGDNEYFEGSVSDFEDEPDPTGNDAVVYAIDAVGNEYEETFDRVVIPALKKRNNNGVIVFGTTVEKMASDMHRVLFLAEHLSKDSQRELGEIDREFYGMVKKLIATFDELKEVSIRDGATMAEISKSFEHVEMESDILFRKADVLCKDRWRGPFLGLIHRIGDALNQQ